MHYWVAVARILGCIREADRHPLRVTTKRGTTVVLDLDYLT